MLCVWCEETRKMWKCTRESASIQIKWQSSSSIYSVTRLFAHIWQINSILYEWEEAFKTVFLHTIRFAWVFSAEWTCLFFPSSVTFFHRHRCRRILRWLGIIFPVDINVGFVVVDFVVVIVAVIISVVVVVPVLQPNSVHRVNFGEDESMLSFTLSPRACLFSQPNGCLLSPSIYLYFVHCTRTPTFFSTLANYACDVFASAKMSGKWKL